MLGPQKRGENVTFFGSAARKRALLGGGGGRLWLRIFLARKKVGKEKKANARHFPEKCRKVRPGFMCQLAELEREKSAVFVSFLHLRRLERKTCF